MTAGPHPETTPAERVAALIALVRHLVPSGGYLFKIESFIGEQKINSGAELLLSDLEALLADSRQLLEHYEALEQLGWVRPPF